ncbi:MAG: Arc family DNA-binding protein [Pseudomonadota bacterium]
MTINLSIKNVPDAVADALRARAERNHRSLQGELMAILEHSVSGPASQGPTIAARTAAPRTVPAQNTPKLSIDEVAARAAKLFPKGTASSVNFIREMRDGRYGEEWANTGRHGTPD